MFRPDPTRPAGRPDPCPYLCVRRYTAGEYHKDFRSTLTLTWRLSLRALQQHAGWSPSPSPIAVTGMSPFGLVDSPPSPTTTTTTTTRRASNRISTALLRQQSMSSPRDLDRLRQTDLASCLQALRRPQGRWNYWGQITFQCTTRFLGPRALLLP